MGVEAPLRIVFADDALLVFDKPAGLLSVPGRGPDKQDCLSARAQALFAGALVVHRLDMATSGLMLMARSAAMQRALSAAFESRQVHKRYVAVVHGRPLDSAAGDDAADIADGWCVIDAPILVDWPRRPLRIIDAAGQASATRWRVAPGSPAAPGMTVTRLDLEPVTGRSHQLRVHLQHIGHPILGDALYAPPEVQALSPRLLLHASRLELVHPATGAALQFESPAPF